MSQILQSRRGPWRDCRPVCLAWTFRIHKRVFRFQDRREERGQAVVESLQRVLKTITEGVRSLDGKTLRVGPDLVAGILWLIEVHQTPSGPKNSDIYTCWPRLISLHS